MSLAHRLVDLSRADLTRWAGPVEPVGSIDELAARVGRPLRVAVVRLDGLGDWAMTIPLLTALGRSSSVDTVTAVVPRGVGGLLEHGSADAIQTLTFGTVVRPVGRPRRLRREITRSHFGQRDAHHAGERASGRYDLVICPRYETDIGNNARAWALGTGAAIAGHDPAARATVRPSERGEGALLTLAVRDDRANTHEMERLRALIEGIGLDPTYQVPYGRGFFDLGQGHDGPIVMHTGAGHPNRKWPIGSFAELVRGLLAEQDRPVVLVGGPEDLPDHQVLTAISDRVTTVVPTTRLSDLPSVLAGATVLVGGDSGPAHVAASVGTTPVVISPHPVGAPPDHANSPEMFAPFIDTAVVLRPAHPASPECAGGCRAATAHCIAEVGVDTVRVAVGQVIRAGR